MIRAEMARQHEDARASFAAARPAARAIAASIARTGRLTLLAMGGSHWVNRAAATLYRAIGIEVACEVLSEVLITPLPNLPRTVLVTSQSGNSGELGSRVRFITHGCSPDRGVWARDTSPDQQQHGCWPRPPDLPSMRLSWKRLKITGSRS